jgi:hypothetical protein
VVRQADDGSDGSDYSGYELLIPPDEHDRVIQRLSALRDARTLDSGVALKCGESEDESLGIKI